eukprot:764744-Hanusia_phi.AAC.1
MGEEGEGGGGRDREELTRCPGCSNLSRVVKSPWRGCKIFDMKEVTSVFCSYLLCSALLCSPPHYSPRTRLTDSLLTDAGGYGGASLQHSIAFVGCRKDKISHHVNGIFEMKMCESLLSPYARRSASADGPAWANGHWARGSLTGRPVPRYRVPAPGPGWENGISWL